jgi:hypothetical protein
MNHLNEEELIRECLEAMPVPERGPEYGQQVWERIEHRLPVNGLPVRAPRVWFPWRWAAAAGFAMLLIAAFLAGRFFPWTPQPQATASNEFASAQVRERVLRAAVGDYLERSQVVLVELANASPKDALDITAEQERAADLVTENRLYRQTADRTGDAAVAGLLEELERALLEITHAPSRISPEELETLRQRLEAEGILFKIRVLGTNVREL